MITYDIKFRRSNGTIGIDNFTEINKTEAIRSFRACYRNDAYEILSIEEIEQNHVFTDDGGEKLADDIDEIANMEICSSYEY